MTTTCLQGKDEDLVRKFLKSNFTEKRGARTDIVAIRASALRQNVISPEGLWSRKKWQELVCDFFKDTLYNDGKKRRVHGRRKRVVYTIKGIQENNRPQEKITPAATKVVKSAPPAAKPVQKPIEPKIQKTTEATTKSLPPQEPPMKQAVVEEVMAAPTVQRASFSAPKLQKAETLSEMLVSKPLTEVADNIESLDEVSALIHKMGLEDANLIFGIDYTGSNYMKGKKTFGRRCLHDISSERLNPYQEVMSTLGETLEPFDADGEIPAFGFGDLQTKDHGVFELKKDGIAQGFKELLSIYNTLTPHIHFSGPTNFAPLIHKAIEIVKEEKSYHILVIVADGEVTSERETTEAIVEASNYPLSIITVGVGDGPWDLMHDFDDKLPQRQFDNFHFVPYAEVTTDVKNPNYAFALHALKEIPAQYKSIRDLNLRARCFDD